MTSVAAAEGTTAGTAGRPLHVVHAVLRLDVGGLERVVLDLARLGVRRGHRVTVLCLERPGTLAPDVEAAGASVVCLDKPPGVDRGLPGRIAGVLADRRPDVVHTHQVGVLWYVGKAGGLAVPGTVTGGGNGPSGRMPIVHTEHGNHVGLETGRWRRLKLRALWHLAARRAGVFCCVSADIARSARRWGTVPAGKVEVVTNGIDVGRYAGEGARGGGGDARRAVRAALGIPAGAAVVGTVGRLVEVKRQHWLLRTLADLVGEAGGGDGPGGRDVRLLLVGDGPERENLAELAAELGVADRVHFAGYQSAPERFLAAMDVFALPSRLEGLPLSLLEAWASGVPVTAAAVGGIPKAVEDGRTGLLFAGDDPAGLTAAVRRLLGDPALARTLAANGLREVAERYSLDRMADEYEARYRRVIAGCR